MILKFNPDKLFAYNDDITSHQSKWLREHAGIECDDIIKRGGASIAIANIIEADKNEWFLGNVFLPSACFCRRYTESGWADLRTLMNSRYRNGIAIKHLVRAGYRFKAVAGRYNKEIVILQRAMITKGRELPIMEPVQRMRGIWIKKTK